MTSTVLTKDDILDVSLTLAASTSWDTLRLYDVAKELDVSLADIQLLVREKDDVTELLFDRADSAMLRGTVNETLSTRQKLYEFICLWLAVLAPYKMIVRRMLIYKLEPGHFYFQARGITRISRTVQWFMEAAGVSTRGPRRAVEEVILTAIYLKTFMFWMFDNSKDSAKTNKMLQSILSDAERAAYKADRS